MNNPIRRLNLLWIGIICLVMAARCANEPLGGQTITASEEPSLTASGDGSESCSKFECWAGIRPGVTSRSKAMSLLQLRYGSHNVTVNHNDIEWKSTDNVDLSKSGWLSVGRNEIVREVNIYVSEDRLDVESIIQLVGEPSTVFVVRAFSSEVFCAGAGLVFPESGIIANLYPDGDSVGVSPTQSISYLVLLSPSDAENWWVTDTYFLEWDGHIDYCDLVDG